MNYTECKTGKGENQTKNYIKTIILRYFPSISWNIAKLLVILNMLSFTPAQIIHGPT